MSDCGLKLVLDDAPVQPGFISISIRLAVLVLWLLFHHHQQKVESLKEWRHIFRKMELHPYNMHTNWLARLAHTWLFAQMLSTCASSLQCLFVLHLLHGQWVWVSLYWTDGLEFHTPFNAELPFPPHVPLVVMDQGAATQDTAQWKPLYYRCSYNYTQRV